MFSAVENVDTRSFLTYAQLRQVPVFSYPSGGPGLSGKALIERPVLVEAFQCVYLPACLVSLVLFPRIDNSQATLRIEAVSWHTAGRILEGCVFTHRDTFHPNWLGVVPDSSESPAGRIRSVISMLDERKVPCLAISGSFEALTAFAQGERCQDILAS